MTNHTQLKRKPKQTISRATNHLLQLEEIPKDKLQRAIDTKQNLTPTMVMAIQRTLGNKAATKIVQQQNPNSIQRFTEGDLLKAFDKAYNEVLFMDFIAEYVDTGWKNFPLIIPPDWGDWWQNNSDRAQTLGLSYRPTEDIIRDILDWHQTLPEDYQLRIGLSSEDEKRLLDNWRS